MAKEEENKEEKSNFGERMSDISGMMLYKDGKWVPIATKSVEVKQEPKKKP